MANVKRLIGLLTVLFAALALTGCGPALRGEFRDAIQEGNLARVKSMLAEKPELVNAKESGGWTALHEALTGESTVGKYNVAKILIAKGANVNARSWFIWGNTPLYIAAGPFQVKEVTKEKGWELLRSTRNEVVELLIDKGANVNAKHDDGRTALHEAAYCSDTNVVELLIENGANVNAKNKHRVTPLSEAAYVGSREVVELLIANGADVNIGSPLLRAFGPGYNEYKEVVKLLIDNGADVNTKAKHDGDSPLHQAALRGLEEIVKLLIANGANVNAKNKYGRTPLHWPAYDGDKEIVQLLIANGANVNAKDDDGMTPLHAATQGGEKEVAEILVAEGGDVTAKIKGIDAKLREKLSMPGSAPFKSKYKSRLRKLWPPGSTPLHLAAAQGHQEIVRLLIESGADVNAKDDEGRTPLAFMALYEMYKGGGHHSTYGGPNRS